MWLAVQSPLLAFSAYFLTDLLLYLLESFQEELFNITALIEDHLTEGLDFSQLRVLGAHYFSEIDYFLLLITDNLLMLVPHQLLLFLKVFNDLPE